MDQHIVYDYIKELVKSIKRDGSIYIGDEKWDGSMYLLGQIIRQYCIPKSHYFVSAKAKELWERITDEDMLNYWYQHKVRCLCDEVEIKEFSGNSNSYTRRIIHRGDEFVYRAVFHDEHIVPVKIIIEELCSYTDLTYADIRRALSKIYICKLLKEEDKKILHKSNRPSDYREALKRDYFADPANIDVYQFDDDGNLKPYEK